MPMLNKEDIEIRATGKVYNSPGVIAHGKPLYEVIDLKTGKRLYPPHISPSDKDGDLEYPCKRWVEENCRWPGDREFSKDLLKKIRSLEEGEKLKDITVVENRIVYEGDAHYDYFMVFEQKGKYYSLEYYSRELGTAGFGKMHQRDACDLGKKYLCRRVYPKKEVITRTVYRRDLGELVEEA